MASNFTRKLSRNIGTSPTSVGTYTVAASTQVTIIGLSLANVAATQVNVTVEIFDGVNSTRIVKDAPIPVGGSLVAIGGEQKVVLVTGDSVRITSNTASSVDAALSLLEIT